MFIPHQHHNDNKFWKININQMCFELGIAEAYSWPCQTAIMDFFCKNSYQLLVVKYFCKIWHHEWRSSPPQVFLGKGVLKICSKFTGEHPCQNVMSIKLLCNFIEIVLRHGCSAVDLLHIFRRPFYKNTYGGLLLQMFNKVLITPLHCYANS